jgi:peptidase M28-like protein/fibronectin type III domain protein/WD40 repeat protein
MKRPLALTAAVLAALWIPASGRAPESPLQSAALAWDRGDYVTALTAYLQLLDSADAESAIEPIALQTGELFQTTELTSDGAEPSFSPDGRYITYETGTPLTRRTRLILTGSPANIAMELPGGSATFSPDGSKVAYLSLTPSRGLEDAQAALDSDSGGERQQRQAAVNRLIALESRILVRDLSSGQDTPVDVGQVRKQSLAFAADRLFFAGGAPTVNTSEVYSVPLSGGPPTVVTSGDGDKAPGDVNATGTSVIFTIRTGRGGGGGGDDTGGGRGGPQAFGVVTLPEGRAVTITGSAPSFSADGRSLAHVAREGTEQRLLVAPANEPTKGSIVRKGTARLDAPALSRDGSRITYQMMPKEDWEVYVINRDGTGEIRVTREIQHDIIPKFLTTDRLIGTMGEPRHRRSYLYDLPSMKRTRLFHNNLIRTIAPEYAWVVHPDGTKILITAERDGNTVSPARGIYLMDLARKVTRDELRARVRANLDTEQALRAKGKRLYAAIAANVKQVVADASVVRVYGYEKRLFDFDSKYVTQPGNKLAAAFLHETYTSFGYEPEYQPFQYRARNGQTGQTANVLATLKGTVNPELIYVVSSHYDSVAAGPGADDDSSGTAALLETARLLAKHPQPATIIFASFTGEEAGLLGSREFVRQAVANKLKVVGALNNDMVGWANDHRLDNTIRYSNAGIRDIQHAAAMQFSDLVTYDALYYKSTDAAAYYEAYGDIVGGIGSYPVLGNPHYHQSHDLLDTINHQLVTEVSKTTAATLMLLASSPSRLKDLKVDRFNAGTASLSWTPSPETGVTGYLVAYGPASKPEAQQVRVTRPVATLTGIAPGTVVSVKAVNVKGLEGWDAARVIVQ